MCSKANAAEWLLKGKVTLWPGMGPSDRRAAIDQAATAVRVSAFSAVWDAARGILRQDDPDTVSGRLVLIDKATEDGSGRARSILTHGLRHVLQRWRDLPVLLLDATLPDVEVLRRFLPDIEVVANIEATTPHATVRQVLGAPTSAGKLMRSEVGRNREAVRRAILHRFVEAGRCPTLVVAQLELEVWLQASGLPATINIAHFGAIAGLDGFKDVGLLIVVGRTMPNVVEVEAMSGVISGVAPVRTAEPERGPRWYDRTRLALRMADGIGHPVDGDRHPDPIAEAMRWQVAEAGVLQAIGRARAVNRTAANPVTIEVWNDLALPVTVDEVVAWGDVPAGHEADMLADGIGVDSPSDMAACWPRIWATEKAARQWRDRLTRSHEPIENISYRALGPCDAWKGCGQGVVPFVYQHPGGRQKWRRGWHVPAVCPDPRGWLEGRLGVTLARFEVLVGDDDEG